MESFASHCTYTFSSHSNRIAKHTPLKTSLSSTTVSLVCGFSSWKYSSSHTSVPSPRYTRICFAIPSFCSRTAPRCSRLFATTPIWRPFWLGMQTLKGTPAISLAPIHIAHKLQRSDSDHSYSCYS